MWRPPWSELGAGAFSGGRVNVANKYSTSRPKLHRLLDELDIPGLRAMLDGDVLWDEVAEVRALGRQKSIAIQTSHGTVLLEDVITHNTMLVAACMSRLILRDPSIRVKIVAKNLDRAQKLSSFMRSIFLPEGAIKFPVFHEVFSDFVIGKSRDLLRAQEFRHPLSTLPHLDSTVFSTFMKAT